MYINKKLLLNSGKKLNKYFLTEARLNESKKDEEEMRKWVGDELTDKFISMRSKFKSPENDYYYWIKKAKNGEDTSELETFLNDFVSKTSEKKAIKENGAKLIVNEDGFKVYFITTYPAAVKYGANTKWCITGRYDGHEERGEEYFNSYKDRLNLDGYYFMITPDNHKFCFLVDRKHNLLPTEAIWNELDDSMTLFDFIALFEEE